MSFLGTLLLSLTTFGIIRRICGKKIFCDYHFFLSQLRLVIGMTKKKERGRREGKKEKKEEKSKETEKESEAKKEKEKEMENFSLWTASKLRL